MQQQRTPEEPESTCWVCCEGGDGLIHAGCGCRGSSGISHLRCLVQAAQHDVDSWTTCPTCGQYFTGDADVGLARARWALVESRPAEDEERLFVANNLAVALKESAGDYTGALRLMEEVLAVRRRTLGDLDPSTLDSMTNLALQHTEMGNYDAAEPLSREAVASMRRTLGDLHAHTLVSIGSLAALLSMQGKFAEAKPLHEEVLAGRRSTLGPDHLDTINSMHGLGRCLVGLGGVAAAFLDAEQQQQQQQQQQQHQEEGLTLLREAVAKAQRVLGHRHPSTQHFAAGLAMAEAEAAATK